MEVPIAQLDPALASNLYNETVPSLVDCEPEPLQAQPAVPSTLNESENISAPVDCEPEHQAQPDPVLPSKLDNETIPFLVDCEPEPLQAHHNPPLFLTVSNESNHDLVDGRPQSSQEQPDTALPPTLSNEGIPDVLDLKPEIIKVQPDLTSNLDISIVSALLNCEPQPLQAQPDPALPESHFKTLCTLSDLFGRELFDIFDWAKKIPGFIDVNSVDQSELIHTTWGEILSFSIAYRTYRSVNSGQKLFFTPDFTIDKEQMSKLRTEFLFNKFMLLVKRLEDLSISKEEYLMLKALLLTNADIYLKDPRSVGQLRDVILSGLQDCVAAYSTKKPMQHLCKLMLLLPLVRSIGSDVIRFWIKVMLRKEVPMTKFFYAIVEHHIPDSHLPRFHKGANSPF